MVELFQVKKENFLSKLKQFFIKSINFNDIEIIENYGFIIQDFLIIIFIKEIVILFIRLNYRL